ncbi:MAG: hypothetical protein AAB696_00535 [Patescibacteria group bacterium]
MIYEFVRSFIKYLTALLALLLGIRLVFKFLVASPKAIIVDLIYQITGFIIFPFKFIFANIYLQRGGVIDIIAISAMIGYFILIFVIIKFLDLIFRD